MTFAAPLMIAAVSHPATASVVASVAAAVGAGAAVASGGVASFITTTVPSLVASMLPSGVTTTVPHAYATGFAITVPEVWEFLAVFAGGLSGGLAAVRRKLDLFGILTLAIVTGLGGGIIRDLLLQRFGIAAFQDNRLLLTALAAAAVVFFFSETSAKLTRPMSYIDAVSLGLFVVVGADKALRADLNILPAIMLGVITAVGGGILRDLLSGEVLAVLQPGALYSFAAMVGSTAFVLAAVWLGVVKEFAALFAITLAVALRFLAMWRGWQSPVARDYSEHLTRLPRRLMAYTPFYSPLDKDRTGEDSPPSDEEASRPE
jgi:uncharacterized membrane protein YeiH